jgi:thiamine biosynthesis lipoprotein
MANVRRMRPLLGTYVEVGAHGPQADAAIEAAFASIEQAHALWSFQSPRSELSSLNTNPCQRVPMRQVTLRLLRLAKALMRASNGAFDCTVGGLLVDKGVLPSHGGPNPLPSGTFDDIKLGSTWACLRRPVRLTLDGIAKGYAVDLAIDAMRTRGAQSGWINAGGDVCAFGDLTLALQRREFDGVLSPLGGLRNAAAATSRTTDSDTPQCDDFPACIVTANPNSAPAPGVWTVLARTAWRADALTKVAANTPPALRHGLISLLGGRLVGASVSV